MPIGPYTLPNKRHPARPKRLTTAAAALLAAAVGASAPAGSIFDDGPDLPTKPVQQFKPPEVDKDLYRPEKKEPAHAPVVAPPATNDPAAPVAPVAPPAPAVPPAAPAAPNARLLEPPPAPLFRKEVAKYKSAIVSNDPKAAADHLWRIANGTDEPTDHYVLMYEAMLDYFDGGDVPKGIKALESLAAAYNVDVLHWKLKTLERAQHDLKMSPTMCASICTVGMQLIRQTRQTGRWDLLATLGPQVRAVGVRSKDPVLEALSLPYATEAEAFGRLFQDAKVAQARLSHDPTDAWANMIKGEFVCLVQNDWQAGLPLLAKAPEAKLRDLAAKEQSAQATLERGYTPTAPILMALADGWWKLAEEAHGKSIEALYKARSFKWFELAYGALDDAEKARVQTILAEKPTPPAALADAQLPDDSEPFVPTPDPAPPAPNPPVAGNNNPGTGTSGGSGGGGRSGGRGHRGR